MDTIIDSLMSECYRKAWITQFVHVLINGAHDDPECVRRLNTVVGCCCSESQLHEKVTT